MGGWMSNKNLIWSALAPRIFALSYLVIKPIVLLDGTCCCTASSFFVSIPKGTGARF